MKTFFGIPLHRITGDDGQYVELVRRQMLMSRRIGWFGLAMAVLSLCIGFGIPLLVIRLMSEGRLLLNLDIGGFLSGFLCGFLLFSLAGFFTFLGVIQLGLAVSSLKGNRTEKLLVKYFDLVGHLGSDQGNYLK